MSLVAPVWGWAASFSPLSTEASPGISSGAEQWPADLVASTCSFRLQANRTRHESPITRTTQILDRPGKRWVASYTFRRVGNVDGGLIDALLVRGQSYLMHDHARPLPQNGVIAGVTLAGPVTRGATSVLVTGLPVSQTHIKAGDYLGIAGRLYMAVRDVPADSLGNGIIYLNRGLLVDSDAATAVNFNTPTCEMILQDDDQNDRTVSAGYLYEYVLSFVEPGVVVN